MGLTQSSLTLDLNGLQALIDLLGRQGFTVLGPTVRNGAIVPGRLASTDDLPRGWATGVGCGRCLTWCPVGVDTTEEVAAIRAEPQPQPEHDDGRH